jgi:hypothetical protein
VPRAGGTAVQGDAVCDSRACMYLTSSLSQSAGAVSREPPSCPCCGLKRPGTALDTLQGLLWFVFVCLFVCVRGGGGLGAKP